ncbi:sugar porter family MFS transporter [Galbibacter sp. EGI 63066]|uniref:sugar porter family MFS transporter n=1 Tax=Galbibacter sp. EGI 63066 TaxID=2993559 RepID=UPI0022492FF5|nr:sugar porter family MFS transporter [Galbibacter sp. EGI 63066]MCX2679934.1 sugar porter family MFS transporter [Galbibacter sp. EGI 63066]
MSKVFQWAIIISLGGFLFGFDTAVISGAEQSIQQVWGLSDLMHGFSIAVALYGTLVGAIFGGFPSDRMGRRKTLFWIAILFLASAVGSALAPEVYSFITFRFIGGIAVGASSVTAPIYISEISQAKNRGKLVASFQLNLVLGILMAYVSNYIISLLNLESAWRWMLGVEALPALAFALLVRKLPRSPRWVLAKLGAEEEAVETLKSINEENYREELEAIKESLNEDKEKTSLKERFFSMKFSFLILLAFLFAFFNQLSGINSVIYFAPRIFADAGLGSESSMLSTVGIGIVNLVFTMLGMYLIDRSGRKKLMYIGSIGYIISLFFIGRAFDTGNTGGSIVPVLSFLFIASHAIGQGAVIWVFISEIFPNRIRAYGMSLGSSTHWVFAALITNFFPYFTKSVGPSVIFYFFCGMMVLQLLFVIFLMPETKGKSLEGLSKILLRK